MSRFLLSTVIVFLSIGCSKQNPLIGKWKIAPGQTAMCKEITFTKNRMFCGSAVEEVDYEILDGQVIVTGNSKLSKAIGAGISYKLVKNYKITSHNFLGSKVEYTRQSY